MPVNPTYPGVYIQEEPIGNKPITGVSTSVTAFVGKAKRGPIEKAVDILSFMDYEKKFGGLDASSEMSYAVRQFFMNAGTKAWVVRLVKSAEPASKTFKVAAENVLTVTALEKGGMGNNIEVRINFRTSNPASIFNLILNYISLDNPQDNITEAFKDLSMNSKNPRYVENVVNGTSKLVEVRREAAGGTKTYAVASKPNVVILDHGKLKGRAIYATSKPTTRGVVKREGVNAFLENGLETDYTDSDMYTVFSGSRATKTGIYALEDVDIFNLLCLPGISNSGILMEADSYCKERRAFLIADSPKNVKNPADMATIISGTTYPKTEYGAIYYPWIRIADPLNGGKLRVTAPCGTIAGIYARTDSNRGVWKAPAGTEATLTGVKKADYLLTDDENGNLNPLGVNCIRIFPSYGAVSWGARTLRGSDQLTSEYKYVPVRRTALFIEESLYRGLEWVVFEPNDEPLWTRIRLNVGAFMHNLFLQGAFLGKTPREAYFVKCDNETITQNDINLGIVNILVGFAPLKPAEFVIIRIQQIAGKNNQ